jgi:hypothetical protein
MLAGADPQGVYRVKDRTCFARQNDVELGATKAATELSTECELRREDTRGGEEWRSVGLVQEVELKPLGRV